MTTLYLVRHGEKVREKGDPALTEIGKKQALHTALYLSQFPIQAIYASPMLRTKQTAEIIAHKLNAPVMLEPLLTERMNWEQPNLSFEQFVRVWNFATEHPTRTPAFGDSVVATATRMQQVIEKAAQKYPDAHIVLVTHGGTIRDFLTTYSEEMRQLFEERTLEGIRECSITQIVHNKGEISLSQVAFEAHLP